VLRSKEGISLSQRKYTLDLLADVGMLNCKPADTPIVQNLKFEKNPDDPVVNWEAYQKLIGKLIYLSHTIPDIAYAISMVSLFMHNPKEQHMDAVMRVLKYLKKRLQEKEFNLKRMGTWIFGAIQMLTGLDRTDR